MSNYPQGFATMQSMGGYGNYSAGGGMGMYPNSGPPAPPMGGGYGGGYGGGGYGGGGYTYGSAYNNMGAFNCQAVMNMGANMMSAMAGGYPMGSQAPPQPPQPPMSYSHQPVVQHQMELNMQRQMYQQMGYQAPKPPRPPAPEGQEPEEEPEEEEDSGKPAIDEDIKAKMKAFYVDELMRRYSITSTFELAVGTVQPLIKYPQDDMVVKWYKENRDTDLTGEDWDPEADCEYLNEAMKGFGTGDELVIHISSKRCNAQRQQLKKMFLTLYGMDLIDRLEGELSGDYKKMIVDLYVSPAYYDAKCIKKAIYGLGTDELALIEILMTRTNQQMNEIRNVYGSVARPDEVTYETLINDDIDNDTSGDFKRLLISCAQGNRTELSREKIADSVEEVLNANGDGTGMFEVNYSKLANVGRAKRDARLLFEAGEDRWGTDEETFNRIFAVRDFYQLREIYNQYVKVSQADISHAINSETSGSYKKGLAAVAQSVMNRPKFFALRLWDSMKGLGTDERTLIRIIASRSEIDMVQIKAEFLELTKKTLYRYIEEDTSFNFKDILTALVGQD